MHTLSHSGKAMVVNYKSTAEIEKMRDMLPSNQCGKGNERRGVNEQLKQTDEAFSTFSLIVQSGRKRESSKSSGQATKIKKENKINRCSIDLEGYLLPQQCSQASCLFC